MQQVLPVTLSERVQAKFISNLSSIHCIWKILFVSEYKQDSISQLILKPKSLRSNSPLKCFKLKGMLARLEGRYILLLLHKIEERCSFRVAHESISLWNKKENKQADNGYKKPMARQKYMVLPLTYHSIMDM